VAERSLRFDLVGRDKSFSRTLDQAGRKGERLNRQFQRVLGDAGDRGGTLFGARLNKRLGGGFSASAAIARKSAGLIAGAFAVAGVVQFAKDSVTAAATFDKTMRQVATVAKLPTSAIKDLRNVALDMGAKTSFSASQASEAMLELAKGGLTAAQIKGGALEQTLVLAAAGGIELGDAAGYVVKSLNTFGLRVDKATDVAAALAGGANASTASVEDLGMALSQVGPGAKTAGLDIQETVGVLAAFADAGIQGTDAGTSLKAMLTRLVPSTAAARSEMKRLGLDFVDSKGNILGIEQVAEQLQQRLGKLSQAQRIAALATIFGSDATRAATVLADQGAEGLARYIKATHDRGAAEKLAKSNTEGAAGAFERLQGSIETVQIIIGTALLPKLADAADWASKKLPEALATLQEKLRIIHGWWKDNADIIGVVGQVLNTIFVPATKDAKTSTDDMRTSAQKLQESLNEMLEIGLRAAQGFNFVAQIAGILAMGFWDLVVAGGKTINVIDRLMGGTGHAADAMVDFARDMRDKASVSLDKLGRDARDTQRAIDKLHGKHIEITGALKLNFSSSFTQKDWVQVRIAAGRMAAGGGVFGSGPRGKDSELRWLAPGEHVWTDREVVASGGHAAMERWRKAVLAGAIPELAGGGPVGQIDTQARAVNKVQAWGTGRRMDAGLTKLLSSFGVRPPHVAGGWQVAVNMLRRLGMIFDVISTFRPGARTRASGSVSYHALNRAVDLAGPNMLAIFEALSRTDPTELIYSGASRYKSRRGWSPIGRLDPVTLADHWSHVHAAYDRGGLLPPGTSLATNRTGRPELVFPAGLLESSFRRPLQSWVVPWLKRIAVGIERGGLAGRIGATGGSTGGGAGTPGAGSGGAAVKSPFAVALAAALRRGSTIFEDLTWYGMSDRFTDATRFHLERKFGLARAWKADHWDQRELLRMLQVHGYDQGGWLMPGTSVATNRTGQPERVVGPKESLIDARAARMIGRAVADELVKAGLGAVNLDSRRVEQVLAGARLSNARR